MRTYVAVTGIVFALFTLMHVWRMIAEQRADFHFVAVTAAIGGLAVWAGLVWRRTS